MTKVSYGSIELRGVRTNQGRRSLTKVGYGNVELRGLVMNVFQHQ